MTVSYFKESDVRRALGRMFLGFSGSGACRNPEERMKVYVEALSRIPVTFVEEACDYALRGKLGPGPYPPSAPQLYELATELQARTFRKQIEPESQLQHTPQQRFRIVAGFRQLVGDLKTGRPIDADLDTAHVFQEE